VAVLATLAQDLRYGLRLLRRTPGFAAAATLTIALGIGATTAMFSVVYGVVLKALPYGEPDRLVNIWTPRRSAAAARLCRDGQRLRLQGAQPRLRRHRGASRGGQLQPHRPGGARALNGSRVSANLFPVLRVTPLLGRTFTEDEDEIGHERVALLGYGLWQRRFGADPSIVGRRFC
jgi:hypothetical protein